MALVVAINSYPQNVLISNALSYQKDDIIILGDIGNSDLDRIQSKYADTFNFNPLELSNFQLLGTENQFEGTARIEYSGDKIKISILEYLLIYFEKNCSIQFEEDNIKIDEIDIFHKTTEIYDAIIYLPENYVLNSTISYLGFDFKNNIIPGYNDADVEKLDKYLQDLEWEISKLIKSEDLEWNVFFIDNIEILKSSLDTLQLAIFVIAMFVFSSLVMALIFMQQRMQNELAKTYRLLSIRGMGVEKMQILYSLLYVSLNLILSVISLDLANYFVGITSISAITTIGIASISSGISTWYSSGQDFTGDNDVFNIDVPIPIAEVDSIDYVTCYPSSLNMQIAVLNGFILVDDQLGDIHSQFKQLKNPKLFELWVREGKEMSKFIDYLSNIKLGNFTDLVDLNIDKWFPANAMLPGNPDFLLFTEKEYVESYQGELFIIASGKGIQGTQQALHDSLSGDLIWLDPGYLNLEDYSLNYFIDTNIWLRRSVVIIGISIYIFLLGMIDSSMLINKEILLLKIKGIQKQAISKASFILVLSELLQRFLAMVIASYTVVSLIEIFQLLGNVNAISEIISISITATIIFGLGQLIRLLTRNNSEKIE